MDEIVISGISGRFPECDNVKEFEKCLFEGIDMVTEDDRRWPSGILGTPSRTGKLKDLEHFDAHYFSVNAKQAKKLSPMVRILLEASHEAIVDAGVNPAEIRGSRTGVFIGTCFNENSIFLENDLEQLNGYNLLGGTKAMLSNRISFAFDFKGPSLTIDSACSSSMLALENAISAIRSGECEAAIVGGSNLLLDPKFSYELSKLGMLSIEGKIKAFDEGASGFVRSEAIGVVFLQPSSQAKRIYATIVAAKTKSDGYKSQGITFPCGKKQKLLIRETYDEFRIDPADIEYVEAHGTGTAVGDPEEINALEEVFCINRREPLLIGSLKSNMGHGEGSCGICSLVKVILMMENGIIPKNLHYQKPNPNIPSLKSGVIKVVDRNLPYRGGLVAINSFGLGGTNVHVVLRPNGNTKKNFSSASLPRLLVASGRTKEAVECILSGAEKCQNDVEFLALLNNLHQKNIPGHRYRGYKILDNDTVEEISDEIITKPPVWFVYPGMGAQWAKMGKDLMKLEVFKRSIDECSKVLKNYNIDLKYLLTESDSSNLNKTVEAFVANTAFQIALTDLLTDLSIKPDGIVGHSFGEIGCAYSDGSLTFEQALLVSYYRGVAVVESDLPNGLMALVGLSSEKCLQRCPPKIEIACYNSENNVIIVGPSEDVLNFMQTLHDDGVLVCLVNTPKYAFHSHYITNAGEKYRNYLNKVIVNSKPRSSKWISTSIPDSDWNKPLAKLSSPEYYVNNLLSPVLFYQAIQHIPKNAIVIEISPNATFTSVLKNSLGKHSTCVSLSKKNHSNNVLFFLSNIGKLYTVGLQPHIERIYPQVSFPVSRGTPMINSIIRWDHSTRWYVPKYTHQVGCVNASKKVTINLNKEEHTYLEGHKLYGRITFPATGFLTMVWKVVANKMSLNFEEISVVFENVTFLRATVLSKNENVHFHVNVLEKTGNFEISEGSSVVVTGKISVFDHVDDQFSKLSNVTMDLIEPTLKSPDIYKNFRLRGYEFGDSFEGLIEADIGGSVGKVKWTNNWTRFLDIILHVIFLTEGDNELLMPIKIHKVVIDPKLHKRSISNNLELPVKYHRNHMIVRCGGIEFKSIKYRVAPISRVLHAKPKLEKYEFIPHQFTFSSDYPSSVALKTLLDIILENSSTTSFKIVEITNKKQDSFLIPSIKKILNENVTIIANYVIITPTKKYFQEIKFCKIILQDEIANVKDFEQDTIITVMKNGLDKENSELLKRDLQFLKNCSFLLLHETKLDLQQTSTLNFQVISIQTIKSDTFVLLRKLPSIFIESTVIKISQDNFSWLEPLKHAIQQNRTVSNVIYLVAQGETCNGLIGFVNCLVKELGTTKVRSFFIQDKNAEQFSFASKFYKHQIEKDLVHNVFQNGVWGSYRHIEINRECCLQVEHGFLDTLRKGNLASFKWIENSVIYDKLERLCTIYYAPLNFRDIMLASGNLPSDALPKMYSNRQGLLGLEFSGRNFEGKRIMGVLKGKGLATTCSLDTDLVWDIPDRWSMDDAATIPVVYATSYYSLIIRGNLLPGETVLIHSGTGGVGLAAISIALHMNCTVFTTVGNENKRTFLKEMFPKIKDEHIGFSRNASFLQMVLQHTNGKGVDVVLNSLPGKLLQASLECVKMHGRFLELGKTNMLNDSPMGLNVFLKNISFHSIMLDQLIYHQNYNDLQKLHILIKEGITNGVVKPLPRVVYEVDRIEQAFRFMASGKHKGKVLIKIRDEEKEETNTSKIHTVNALHRTYMYKDKSYVLIGGLGGFGLELADWLIKRGASKIVLSSRTGIKTGYQRLCIRKWISQNVLVLVSAANVTTLEGVETLLTQAKSLGPVGGVFNLAVILKDALIENQTENNFTEVCAPKIQCAKNLNKLTRTMTPELDHFVMFSSFACGRGTVGQTNYGLANSAMERLCEQRRMDGLPGIAIQWGAIGDVGLYWETLGKRDEAIVGLQAQSISSCLASLDMLLTQPCAVVSSLVLADRKERFKTVKKGSLIGSVYSILGIEDVKKISQNVTLKDLGIDSLMVTEIKRTLERDYNIILNTNEIQELTLNKLQTITKTDDGSKLVNGKTNEVKDMFSFVLATDVPSDVLVDMKKNVETVGSPIFLIHSIEGNTNALHNLVKNIKYPTFGLQYSRACTIKSIVELAQFYINLIETIQQQGTYILVGYSFGSCVAIEMAIQLEENGKKVKLILIDGSPTVIKRHLATIFDNNTQSKLNFFVSECIQFFKDEDRDSFVERICWLTTPIQQIRCTEDFIKNNKLYANSINGNALLGLLNRLEAVLTYNSSTNVKGLILLVKANQNGFQEDLKDYDLNLVCDQKVIVEEVDGDHFSILKGDSIKKVAEMLSKFVEKED